MRGSIYHNTNVFQHEQNHDIGTGNQSHGHMLSDEPSNSLVQGETSEEADDDMAENSLHEEGNILSTRNQVQQITCDASGDAGSSIYNNLGRQEGVCNACGSIECAPWL